MIKFDNLDCEITLLSVEEYESMKEHIPLMNDWWWLRSPGFGQGRGAGVSIDGSVNYYGINVNNDNDCVRPALKSEIFTSDMVGEEVSAFGNRWTVCGKGYAISNAPIGHHRFDAKSNDYDKSEIKKWIEDWKRKFDE